MDEKLKAIALLFWSVFGHFLKNAYKWLKMDEKLKAIALLFGTVFGLFFQNDISG